MLRFSKPLTRILSSSTSGVKPSALRLLPSSSFSTFSSVQATKKATSSDSDKVVKPPKKATKAAAAPKAKAAAPKKKKVEKKAKPPKKAKKAAAPKKIRPKRVQLPKRIKNTWMLYMEDNLPAIKAAVPEGEKYSQTKASQELAVSYRQLSQAEKEDLANRLEQVKKQYKVDLEEAIANLTPEQIRSENVARSERRKTGKSNKKNLIDPAKPKRPLSAFFIYLDDRRSDTAWLNEAKSQAMSATDADTAVDKHGKPFHPQLLEIRAISKRAGDEWRAMTDEEKKPFFDQATEGLASYKEAVEAYNREKSA